MDFYLELQNPRTSKKVILFFSQFYNIQLSDVKDPVMAYSTASYKEFREDYIKAVSNDFKFNFINNENCRDVHSFSLVFFNPRQLKHLVKMDDELTSLGCITDLIVEDLTFEGIPKIYALSGRGSRSSLKVLSTGIRLKEEAHTTLEKAIAVWSLPLIYGEEYDKYMIVSFLEKTKVMQITDKLEEAKKTGFDLGNPTLYVAILINNSYIQVIPNGIIHISLKEGSTREYERPLYRTSNNVLCAASNGFQIALGIKGQELAYFELDKINNKLKIIEKKVLGYEVMSLDIPPIPNNREKSKFMSVAGNDNIVRILSLDTQQCLILLSMQEQISTPISILFIEGPARVQHDNSKQFEYLFSDNPLYLFIGLSNGIVSRATIDIVTGSLSDSRTQQISKANQTNLNGLQSKSSYFVNLYKINKSTTIATCNDRPWIFYFYMNEFHQTPIDYEYPINFISGFRNENFFLGLVCLSPNSLKIFNVNQNQLAEKLNLQVEYKLRYTPRKMIVHLETNYIFIIEADQHVLTEEKKNDLKKRIASKSNEKTDYLELSESEIGVPVNYGTWGSCIRVIDPNNFGLLEMLELKNNEAAISMCILNFQRGNEWYLAVGVVQDYILIPKYFTSANIVIFQIIDGKKLVPVHKVIKLYI